MNEKIYKASDVVGILLEEITNDEFMRVTKRLSDIPSSVVRCEDCKHWDGHTEADAETRLMSLPERKTGRWEMKPDPYGFFDEIPVCSECGCTTKMRETYKFCPNCGAEMRKGEEV